MLGVREEDERPERAERGDGVGFETLSSSGELDEAILSQTTMQLFATGDEPPAPPPPPVAAVAPPPAAPEAAFVSREKLRAERSRLVGLVSQRTREEHKVIHARINRATGVSSVSAATREQLEKSIALLRRDLSGR